MNIKTIISSIQNKSNQSFQQKFRTNLRQLIDTLFQWGNPFSNQDDKLFAIDTGRLAKDNVIESIHLMENIGKQQFDQFVKDRLVDQVTPIHFPIHQNKLALFATMNTSSTINKAISKIKLAKSDSNLFSRLYIGCDTRGADLNDFFSHENHPFPPSLSDNGDLLTGTKSDIIIILIIIIMNFYSPVSNTRCHSIGHKMRIARIKIGVDSQGRWGRA